MDNNANTGYLCFLHESESIIQRNLKQIIDKVKKLHKREHMFKKTRKGINDGFSKKDD